MNALTKIDSTPRAELIAVLRDSIWPGAKDASIEMALAYCRVNDLDPFLKPVHIVPMWDKDSRSMRDVLMPGIADYRVKAARSGEYAGKSEPEFGQDVSDTLGGVNVTFPQWCRITVFRIVAGKACAFPAKEYWLENYATAKSDTDAPNKMWKKRPYGQLAKCAEAQALRMAFPEFSGGAPTAEEMEGKSLDGFDGTTIDAVSERVSSASPPPETKTTPSGPTQKTLDTVDGMINKICSCEAQEEWLEYDAKSQNYMEKLKRNHPELSIKLEGAFEDARKRLFPEPEGDENPFGEDLTKPE